MNLFASGIIDAVYNIYSTRGWAGFTRGMNARVLYQIPATSLSWSVYELFKYLLGNNSLPYVLI